MPEPSRTTRHKPPAAPPTKRVEHVRVLVSREGNLHLAQCLEFGLVAQADTHEEGLRGIGNAIGAMPAYAREHDDSPLLYRTAPPEPWEKFERAKMRRKRGGAAGATGDGSRHGLTERP